MKRKNKVVIIAILIACMVLSSVGTVFGAINVATGGGSEGKVEIEQSNQVIVDSDGTEYIASEEEAMAYLVAHADELGIENPEETLTFRDADTAAGYTFYEYGQVYQGIPVYGNAIKIMVGNDNSVKMSNAYYIDISDDVEIRATATERQLVENVEKYLTETGGYTEVEKVGIVNESDGIEEYIFEKEDGEDVLAYVFDVIFSSKEENGNYRIVADAVTGEVLDGSSNIYYGSETVTLKDMNGKDATINVYNDEAENKYYMYDEERNIFIFDSKWRKIDDELVWLFDDLSMYEWKTIPDYVFGKSYKPQFVVSDKKEKWDKEAITLMNSIAYNYDWYKGVFGLNAWDNKDGVTIASYNDSVDLGFNAYSLAKHGATNMFLVFGLFESLKDMDLIAHEYAHSVQQGVFHMEYKGETGAIKEAYADVMGEIIEEDINWYQSCGRNIKNPKKSGNPSVINDKYYADTSESAEDNGGVHQNSTILSHASYLMWHGIEGAEKLNMEQIARLWYITLGMVNDINIDFQNFGGLMVEAAEKLKGDSVLTDAQCECVKEALAKVGIRREVYTVVDTSVECYAKDYYNIGLDNASVKVYESDSPASKYSKKIKGKMIKEYKTDENGYFKCKLSKGKYYTLVVSDDKYSQNNDERKYLYCDSKSKVKKIDIPTDYRKNIVTGFEIDESELALAIDEERYVKVQVFPKGITSKYYTLTWESTDSSIVKVDSKTGKIKGVAEGSAVIRAKLENEKNVFEKQIDVVVTKKQRDTVLVLDRSGSMYGTPMSEMKTAAINFCEEILSGGDNRVDIVAYDDSVQNSGFVSDLQEAKSYIESLYEGDTTNMYAGLDVAQYDLENYARSNSVKNVVIMSDGIPNEGSIDEYGPMSDWAYANNVDLGMYAEYGNAVCLLADELKASCNVYSLGFFHSLYDSDKEYCEALMRNIQNSGYYEVVDAEDLQFTFGDISEEVSDGAKVVINIACPVDVTVEYEGEVLSSSYADFNGETSFGTLQVVGADNDIKVLELDRDKDYDVTIDGKGEGTMDYTVSYYNENDTIDDTRSFESVPITVDTIIVTNTVINNPTELTIDANGDGVKDSVWSAESNSSGAETWKGEELATEEPQEMEESNYEVSGGSNTGWIVLLILSIISLLASSGVLIIVIVGDKKKKSSGEPENGTNDSGNMAGSWNTSNNNGNYDGVQTGSIVILDGSMKGMQITLEDNKMIKVGKDPAQAEVVIDRRYSAASRLHCYIMYSSKYDGYYVIDLSSNGTFTSTGKRLVKDKKVVVKRDTVLHLPNDTYRIKLM